MHLLRLVYRRSLSDRVPLMAAALAYETALGLVPFLAVAFALLKAVGALDARSALVDFFGRQLFPSSHDLVAQLAEYADHVNIAALGGTGLAFSLAVVYLLFHAIEDIWNHIWEVRRRRSLIGKFVIFYTLATLTPALVGLSLYHTARFWRSTGPLALLLPMASTWVALVLANRLLPNTRVAWYAAAIGALVAAVLLEVAKRLFGIYVTEVALSRYDRVYGTMAIVPLFFFWIYINWIIVLVGAEIACAVEHARTIPRDRRAAALDERWALVSGELAARLLVDIAERFRSGRRSGTRVLAVAHGMSESVIGRVLDRLRERGLLISVDEPKGPTFVLARPAEEMRLEEVLAGFRAPPPTPQDDRLSRVLAELEALRRERLGRVTIANLLSAVGPAETHDPPAPPPPAPDAPTD